MSLRTRRWSPWLLFIIMLVACQPTVLTPAATPAVNESGEAAVAPTTNLTDGCIEQFDTSINYFPEQATVTETDGFTVEYHNSYKVVTVVMPWQGASEPLRYALVQCGAPTPEGFAENEIITVPVQRFVGVSTTYLPFLDEFGLLDRLVGLDDTTYVNNEEVLKRYNEGKIKLIGYGSGVNVEQVLDLEPDLVMTYAQGTADADAHPKLLEAGLKVVINSEWLERTPLGRAEWGKFIALFFNQEAAAEALFTATATRYQALAAQAAQATPKPTVFSDTEFQGTWYMPGGQSFYAKLLADAGADYLWADEPSNASQPLSFEEVFDKAQNADFWLNLGFFSSLDELKSADSRYADFAAFQNGTVWNNNARVNANGGNDYYESAIAYPDVVLADLIKIFHPELAADHEFVYYQQLK